MAEGIVQGLVLVPGGPGEAIRTASVAQGGGVLAHGGVDSALHGRGRRARGSRASKGSQVITDGGTPLRLFVFARHAESAANVGHVLSTDPSRPVALTERGRAQARALGAQLANVPIDLAVSSRLLRTRETISIALDGRSVPVLTEPGLDEIQAGDLDGGPMEAYWDWLGQHTATDRLPHGESVDDALRRYGGALRRLLARAGSVTLVVTHELALRHVAGAAAPGRPPRPGTDFPNAVPYLFDEHAVRRAAVGLAEPEPTTHPGQRIARNV
jgi:broad specificity phosphatase PhoE